MAENLAFPAPGSHCFDDDETDCEANGRLYTWDSARSACPPGWRLPSDADWMVLEARLGMPSAQLGARQFRGTDQGAQLRRDGSSGFDAPMAGYRRPSGEYVRRGERAAFWAATEANAEDAWHRDLRPDDARIYRSEVTKTYALSIRCVQDEGPG